MSATPISVRWGGSSGTTCTNKMLRLNVWRSMIQQAQIFQKKAQIVTSLMKNEKNNNGK